MAWDPGLATHTSCVTWVAGAASLLRAVSLSVTWRGTWLLSHGRSLVDPVVLGEPGLPCRLGGMEASRWCVRQAVHERRRQAPLVGGRVR